MLHRPSMITYISSAVVWVCTLSLILLICILIWYPPSEMPSSFVAILAMFLICDTHLVRGRFEDSDLCAAAMSIVDIVLASGLVVMGLAVGVLAYQLRSMYWQQTFLVPLHPLLPLPLQPTPTTAIRGGGPATRPASTGCVAGPSPLAVWLCDLCGRGFQSLRA